MSDWCEISIGENIKITSGFPFPSQYFAEEGFPLIRIRDINSSSTEVYFSGEVPSGYVIKRGDVLVGMDGDFHVVKWKGADALLNQRVMKIDVFENSALDVNFFYHWLDPFIKKINETTAATTVKHLSTKDLTKAKAYLPNLTVQKKIAAALNGVDAVIEKTEALIEKYQQIKAGLMHDLFTRGVLPDGKLRPTREQEPELYRETGIGWIPKEWGIQKVEDCGEVKLGRQRSPDQHSGKWTTPYLRVANVLDGVIDYGDVLEMDFTPTERKLFELYPGDILLNEGQSLELVGRSAIYRGEPGQFCFQNTLVRFRCTPDNHASFFAHLFKLWLDRGAFQIISKQTTSVAHLGADRFAKMVCPKIGLHEQKIIAQRLNSVDERIAKTEAHRKNLAYQKAGLMHDLLTGKVAVKVDEAQEEHA